MAAKKHTAVQPTLLTYFSTNPANTKTAADWTTWTTPSTLYYRDEFVTCQEEIQLIKWIDEQWTKSTTSLYHSDDKTSTASEGEAKRRVLVGRRTQWHPFNETPQVMQDVLQRLMEEGRFWCLPQHVQINEYEPGQGIEAHVDENRADTEYICSISLNTTIDMQFYPVAEQYRVSDAITADAKYPTLRKGKAARASDEDAVNITLRQRSCLVFSGDARHHWQHGITKHQQTKGHVKRGRRLAVICRISKQK